MAAITGSIGVVKVAGAVVAEITGFSVEEGVNLISDSNLNDAAETSLVGRTNWSGSIECMWDDADTGGQGAMTIGASVACLFLPESATTGSAEWSGTGLVESKSLSVSDESMITQSFSLKGTGALTIGTV
jgi:hypothetical protein